MREIPGLVANRLRQSRLTAYPFRQLRTTMMLRQSPMNETHWCRALTKPRTRAIDVGANLGQISAIMARGVGEEGLVVALEPNPECFQQLSLCSRPPVVPLQIAIGSDSDAITLAVPHARDGSTQDQLGTVVMGSREFGYGCTEFKVRQTTLDALDMISDLPVSLIKIDVEGYERAVLMGAQVTIERHRPAMVVEVEERHQPHGQDIDDVFSLVQSWDYVVIPIGPNGLLRQEEFNLKEHQREPLQSGDLGSNYVNNFIFIPAERAEEIDRYYARQLPPHEAFNQAKGQGKVSQNSASDGTPA